MAGELEGDDAVFVDAVVLHIAAIGLEVGTDLVEHGEKQLFVNGHEGSFHMGYMWAHWQAPAGNQE